MTIMATVVFIFYISSFIFLLNFNVLFVGMLYSENNSIMYSVKTRNVNIRKVVVNVYYPLIYGYGLFEWCKSSYARQSKYIPYESLYVFPDGK